LSFSFAFYHKASRFRCGVDIIYLCILIRSGRIWLNFKFITNINNEIDDFTISHPDFLKLDGALKIRFRTCSYEHDYLSVIDDQVVPPRVSALRSIRKIYSSVPTKSIHINDSFSGNSLLFQSHDLILHDFQLHTERTRLLS
jgi:hypothetical protein